MSIKGLLIETVVILFAIIILIIVANNFQTHRNAAAFFSKLQVEHLDSTYAQYEDQLSGDLWIGRFSFEKSLIDEIAKTRNVGVELKSGNKTIYAGVRDNKRVNKIYKLNLGPNKFSTLHLYSTSQYDYATTLSGIWLFLLFEVFILLLGFFYLWWRFHKRLLAPLAEQVAHLKPGKLEEYQPHKSTIFELKELSNTIKDMSLKVQEKALYEAEVQAAKQVAHDIRSPLTSLNFLLSNVSGLPEKQRTLMRASIQRITDIANTLYNKSQKELSDGKTNEARQNAESVMVSAVVESVMSEKRVQIQDKNNIQLHLYSQNVYGAFVKIDNTEFKRILSNLVNNSIEAFDQKQHVIDVNITDIDNNKIQITIEDDGVGIPDEILSSIGTKGFTYGKDHLNIAGTGLGLYHAKETIAAYGGNLAVESELNKGTKVIITLPKCKVPKWFVEKIWPQHINKIIILDDDQSIHNLWRDRFEPYAKKINIIHFSSGKNFKEYMAKDTNWEKGTLFLMDFELLNQPQTGLDLIEELNIGKTAILVTSHYEDKAIRSRVDKIGVKIIPKDMAAFVPVG